MRVNTIKVRSPIAFIGEFPTESDENIGVPFSDSVGKELRDMLMLAGINLSQHCTAYVLRHRPLNNDISKYFVKLKDHQAALREPPIQRGQYFSPLFFDDLDLIRKEILELKPNVIVTLGSLATWAFTGQYNVGSIRGKIHETKYGKVLPTYNPSIVFRQWSLRPIIIADFFKALFESRSPEYTRSIRNILVEPSLSDLYDFKREFLSRTPFRSFDIETRLGQVACIAISAEPSHTLCIPFIGRGSSYWTYDEELLVWKFLKNVFDEPGIIPVAQNGLFDVQYLAKQGIFIKTPPEDTMLLHHAMYPELRKSLDFLASIYTNAQNWKHLAKEDKEQ